jgi:hypothetical protein
MVVTLENGGVTFTFSDGEVMQISSNISGNLDNDSMPISGPLGAMIFDFNGVIKTITLSGALFDDNTNHLDAGTAITINGQRQWLERIVNGNQGATSFDSNYGSSWNGSTWQVSTCLVQQMTFDEQTGDPNRLPFSITLIVGNV